ncbi:protein phosphatase 2C domain-containing protein [Cryptosporidium felis]|nr:protein phosphatase 2C domain-containing protein [Cryptosporidium felis]
MYLKDNDVFREITTNLLRGENVKFYLGSNVNRELYCEKTQYFEFVRQYYINKRRNLKSSPECKMFKIPLLVSSDGLIKKIGWSFDWDNSHGNYYSESISSLKCNFSFVDLYAVYNNSFEEGVSTRVTAGRKLQTEKRDPLTINLNCGLYETKGTRSYMEDRTFFSLDILNEELDGKTQKHIISFFGIYDGHNGEFTVDYLKNYLHKNFCLSFELRNGEEPVKNTVNSLIDAFYLTENQIKQHYFESKKCTTEFKETLERNAESIAYNESQQKGQNIRYISSGSTAIVCCITYSTICIANLGDSRALLCKCGRGYSLTKDHRIKNNLEEKERVKREGGTFDNEGYLSGNLAVSRAFGNWDENSGVKLKGLSSVPEIYIHNITHEDEFLLIACDGIFESFENQEAVSLVRRVLIENTDPNIAAEKLAKAALQRQALDNLSIIIVVLTPPNCPSINGISSVDLNTDIKKFTSGTQTSTKRKIYNFSKLRNLLLT